MAGDDEQRRTGDGPEPSEPDDVAVPPEPLASGHVPPGHTPLGEEARERGTDVPPPHGPAGDERGEGGRGFRTLTLICYVLFLIPTGLTTVVGVVVAYLKREDARDTVWATHFDNLITVFWVTLIVGVVGMALTWVLIGFVVLGVLAVWFYYRCIRGLIRASDDRPY